MLYRVPVTNHAVDRFSERYGIANKFVLSQITKEVKNSTINALSYKYCNDENKRKFVVLLNNKVYAGVYSIANQVIVTVIKPDFSEIQRVLNSRNKQLLFRIYSIWLQENFLKIYYKYGLILNLEKFITYFKSC
jgi:hypothetical protein